MSDERQDEPTRTPPQPWERRASRRQVVKGAAALGFGAAANATDDDQLYAVPRCDNGPGFFYRKDLPDEAGVQPPKTYDEVTAVATQLQTPEVAGFIFQAAQSEGGLISLFAAREYPLGHGGDVVHAEGNVTIDQGTAGVEALTWLVDSGDTAQVSPER